MKLSSIQGRMELLFGAFFVLIVVSVGVTFWGIEVQKDDALEINLAGRQRMLLQQISRLALKSNYEKDPADLAGLEEARQVFETSLAAFQAGGKVVYPPGEEITLSATRDQKISAQLDQLGEMWREVRPSLDLLKDQPAGGVAYSQAVFHIQEQTPELVAQADRIVRSYEAAAAQKMALLRGVQIGFFIAALFLLGLAAYWTRHLFLRPLRELDEAAKRMGHGDLQTPFEPQGLDEVRVLSKTFEQTRVQLNQSQEELLAWGKTLEDRVAKRTRELEGLYQVSRDISSRLELPGVLRTITEQARLLLEANVALLCLVDEPEQALSLHSISGSSLAVVQPSTSIHEALPSRVLAGECALPCGMEGCHGSCGILAEPYRVSHLAAPLRMGERVIGALCVGSASPGAFSRDAMLLLTKLANSAAIAIENARLYEQAERLAVLDERQRLSAEMHDGMAQTINFLRLTAEQVDRHIQEGEVELVEIGLLRLEKALNQLEGEVRRAIDSLQDEIPEFHPLQQQLAGLAKELSGEDARVEWETDLVVPLILSDEQTEQVLRVAREALLNACHHSQADRIVLRLERNNGVARVAVEDNGMGFDPQQLPDPGDRQHFGLKIMRARAARLDGQVDIRSAVGQGSRVVLTWPVSEDS